MKKFCIFLLVLALLIGGAIFALTQYISVDEVQKRVITAVKEKTGRDLAFTSMRFGLVPNIGLRLKDVTLTNPGWAADKTMITLGELNLGLALKPLFSKQIEVTRFVLDHPVIHLEVSADGKKSWEFAALKAKEQPAEKSGKAPEANITKDLGFKFSQFEIKKGTLTFVDRQKGTNVSLSEIDAVVKYPDLASALQVDGTVIYHDKRVNVFASLDAPIDFLNGKPSPGNLNVKTSDFDTKLEGRLATTGTMLDGKIDTNVSSLSNTVGWLKGAKPEALPFEKVSFASAAQATGAGLTLNGASLTLDEVQAKGNVYLGYGGAKPLLKAKVSVNKLNLDRFTGHAEEARAGEAAVKKAAPQEGWDNTPIDFSGLKTVDADLTLQTQGFSLRGADVGPSTLSVQLADGSLHAKSSEATLFGGAFSSDVTVIASATPALAFKFNMKDVQTKPLLTTFADFKKMSGTVDASVDVSANGKSQKAIVESLAGSGAVTFHNGTLEGIDLVNIAQAIESRLGEMGIGNGKTEFVDLGGTFTIKTGIAHNEDLKMRGPLVQATGSGDVNLPLKRVDYRVMPLLTASAKTEGAKGVVVPVDIRGPFNNIKVKPDYKGAIQGILDHPEDAKAAIKNVREKGKTILQDIRKDPKNALGNLLVGGLFGKKQPADTAPETAPVDAPPAETAPAPVTTP